jgi:hypothetical protein
MPPDILHFNYVIEARIESKRMGRLSIIEVRTVTRQPIPLTRHFLSKLGTTINYGSLQSHPLGSGHRSCEKESQRQLPSDELRPI